MKNKIPDGWSLEKGMEFLAETNLSQRERKLFLRFFKEEKWNEIREEFPRFSGDGLAHFIPILNEWKGCLFKRTDSTPGEIFILNNAKQNDHGSITISFLYVSLFRGNFAIESVKWEIEKVLKDKRIIDDQLVMLDKALSIKTTKRLQEKLSKTQRSIVDSTACINAFFKRKTK